MVPVAEIIFGGVLVLVIAAFACYFSRHVAERPSERTWIDVVIGSSMVIIGTEALLIITLYWFKLAWLMFILAYLPLMFFVVGAPIIYFQERKRWMAQQDEQKIIKKVNDLNSERGRWHRD